MKYYFFYENNVPFSLLLVRPLHGKYHTKTTCNYNEPPPPQAAGYLKVGSSSKNEASFGEYNPERFKLFDS
jgi:hypothetical protein